MAVIFLFIDGVGLGEKEESNPFYSGNFTAFEAMAGGQPFLKNYHPVEEENHVFKGIDATLGIEGLPQSGTGQTALFTGRNAAKKIGKHFGPFPHSGIKPLLKNRSVFHKIQEKGKRGVFMNAYPDIYFEKAEERNRWSCTTLMTMNAGIPLRGEEDIRQGRAVTAGITQRSWRENLDIDIPVITPGDAAQRILSSANNYDLLLYEYYLTDKSGHDQDPRNAREVIGRYDQFLSVIINEIREPDTVVLSSDHGNVEDLSTNTHTFNNVPLFAKGSNAGKFKEATEITDIVPAILEFI